MKAKKKTNRSKRGQKARSLRSTICRNAGKCLYIQWWFRCSVVHTSHCESRGRGLRTCTRKHKSKGAVGTKWHTWCCLHILGRERFFSTESSLSRAYLMTRRFTGALICGGVWQSSSQYGAHDKYHMHSQRLGSLEGPQHNWSWSWLRKQTEITHRKPCLHRDNISSSVTRHIRS